MKIGVGRLSSILTNVFLAFSISIAAIWLVCFSGIVWEPERFVVTFWQALLTLAKGWAPLFVPAAVVLFVTRNFQGGITYELCRTLRPDLEKIIVGSVKGAVKESIVPIVSNHVLMGVRSVCRSIPVEGNQKKMFLRAKTDYCEATGCDQVDSSIVF